MYLKLYRSVLVGYCDILTVAVVRADERRDIGIFRSPEEVRTYALLLLSFQEEITRSKKAKAFQLHLLIILSS